MSQYYCFYYFYDQLNATLVIIIEFVQRQISYYNLLLNFRMVVYAGNLVARQQRMSMN